MRKFTLLFALLAFAGMTFAQNASLFKSNEKEVKQMTQTATKAANAPFWYEDFNKDDWSATVNQGTTGGYLSNGSDLPNGWTTVDLSSNGYLWHWSDVGPRGRWTADEPLVPDNTYLTDFNWPAGTTLDNGFMMLESGFYNTNELGEMVSDPLDMNSHLILGPVDCSGKAGVLVQLNTLYRFCCAGDHSFNLEVSADYDPANPTSAHWILNKLNVLTETNNTTNPEERAVEVNISEVAKDQSSVYIRFSTSGLSHYYTIIDDVAFVEPALNDMMIKDAWAEYMIPTTSGAYFWGGYTQLPEDAVSNFETFEAAVYNNGSNDATNAVLTTKIFKDDVLVETLTSPTKNIASAKHDTLTISTTFTPTDIATYQVSMTLAADAADDVTSNNDWGYEFETTAHTYSRVRPGKEDEYGNASTRDWVGGGYDGDMILAEYVIDEDTRVIFSGVNVYIHPTTDEEELAAIANGQFQMKARAMVLDFEAAALADIEDAKLESNLYTVTMADLGTWVYLPYINEGESLKGNGDYYVGIEQYTGTAAELRFRIGSDDLNGVKQPGGQNIAYQGQDASPWANIGANIAINLMINMPEMVNVTFNYDMQGITISDSDVIKVKGSLGDKDEITLHYDGTTKIATGSVYVPKNSTLTFKAYVNDVAEGIDSDRTETVNSNTTLNLTYGTIVNVESDALQFAKLYPNPFNKTLSIENLVDVKEIRVSNMLGQHVMTISEVESKVTISANDLDNGIYFISIIDNNNNVRTERVVKN